MCFEHDIGEYARNQVMIPFANANPTGATQLATLIKDQELTARKRVSMRYRRLLESLESANDVAASLKDFVR